jgi:hypothetical protein
MPKKRKDYKEISIGVVIPSMSTSNSYLIDSNNFDKITYPNPKST